MTLTPVLQLYIGRRFLAAMTATFAGLAVLIFMVDFVELLRRAGKYGDTPVWKLVNIALLQLPAYVEPLIGFESGERTCNHTRQRHVGLAILAPRHGCGIYHRASRIHRLQPDGSQCSSSIRAPLP